MKIFGHFYVYMIGYIGIWELGQKHIGYVTNVIKNKYIRTNTQQIRYYGNLLVTGKRYIMTNREYLIGLIFITSAMLVYVISILFIVYLISILFIKDFFEKHTIDVGEVWVATLYEDNPYEETEYIYNEVIEIKGDYVLYVTNQEDTSYCTKRGFALLYDCEVGCR